MANRSRSEPPEYWSAAELRARMKALASPPATGDELAAQWMVFQDTLLRLQDWWMKHSPHLLAAGLVSGEDAALASLMLALGDEKKDHEAALCDEDARWLKGKLQEALGNREDT